MLNRLRMTTQTARTVGLGGCAFQRARELVTSYSRRQGADHPTPLPHRISTGLAYHLGVTKDSKLFPLVVIKYENS